MDIQFVLIDKYFQVYNVLKLSGPPPELTINYTRKDSSFAFPMSSEIVNKYVLAFNKKENYRQKINSLTQLIYYDRNHLYKSFVKYKSKGSLKNKLVFDQGIQTRNCKRGEIR